MSTQQLIEQVLKRLDDLQDEAAAHIWPEDLKRCMTSECVVEVASVRMGSPDGKTVPLFSREQVAEALAAELERLERKPQWLPIESAPKDGTSVFAFWPPSGLFPVHGGCYGVTRFCGGHWCNPEDEDDQYIWPSHWMPLPAAPDIGEGEGK